MSMFEDKYLTFVGGSFSQIMGLTQYCLVFSGPHLCEVTETWKVDIEKCVDSLLGMYLWCERCVDSVLSYIYVR